MKTKRDFSKVHIRVNTKYFWFWMLLGACPLSSTLICRFRVYDFFLLLIRTINPTTVWIKGVLFHKTSGINSWLCYLLSCQYHAILCLQIRDNAFSLHSFVCFLYLECRKTVCLTHMGQKGANVVETY